MSEALYSIPSPLTDIQFAVETDLLKENHASRLYAVLGDVLEDADYGRLVLYLPFEFLPAATWKPGSKELDHEIKRFKKTYLDAWHDLRGVHDVRANFVDGDVLEPDYRTDDLPRVVKAAHLLPELIGKGMLSKFEAAELLQGADDPVLRQSITEVLTGVSGEIASPADMAAGAPISEARKSWLARERRNRTIEAAARHIAAAVIDDNLPYELIVDALSAGSNTLAPYALTEGIYTAIETVAMANPDNALAIYGRYAGVLDALWKRDETQLRDRLTRSYRRLHRLNIVSIEHLADRKISLPKLAGRLSENLAGRSDDINNLKHITKSIALYPELYECIYPVVTVEGSWLKGYGERGSDVDISVFVRPGVPQTGQTEIRELLGSVFNTANYTYEIGQFWLDEHSGGLRVHNFDERDNHTADSNWAHILFGGAWVGEEKSIRDLQKKLLPAYFYNSTGPGSPDRKRCLEIIEQDALQYRLMHSGYERHYPRYSLPEKAGVNDGSIFWDSGYRRLATRLFIEKVFLPKLK